MIWGMVSEILGTEYVPVGKIQTIRKRKQKT